MSLHFIRSLMTSSVCLKHRKVSVFIATTLDGFIARENGDIDWLTNYEQGEVDHSDSGSKFIFFSLFSFFH
jgi:hypothetical protein